MRSLTRSSGLVALALALSLLVTACGSGSGASDTTTEMPMADAEHEHEHEDGAETREWEGSAPPELSIVTDEMEDGTIHLTVDAPGFTFTGADVFDPVAGEGHAHLYVDGDLMTMIYGPEFQLPRLEPGTHQLMVTLSTNDHLEYTVDGEAVSAMVPLVVETAAPDEGDSPNENVEVTLDVHGGMVHGGDDRITIPLGTTVLLTVTSDTADEVHLHGYDLIEHVHPGAEVTIEFIANVPGIFEVELEESGLLLIELQIG